MKPVFCGNFDYETRHSELERLFSKYGRVDRVDMKSGTSKANRALFGLIMSAKTLHAKEILLPPDHQPLPFTIGIATTHAGFAFIYYDHERDAEDAIRALDNIPFGYSRRRLSVEWSRQADRGSRHRDGSRGAANMRPTKTLFVINFDPINTRIRDIERHFSPYGKILHVRIRRNFAFVQFDTQDEATKALEATNMSKLMDRVVSVEYALRDDNERDVRDSPRRGGGYVRRDSPYGRSVSPVCRSRPSPDYGPARSPAYDRRDGPSRERSRSPEYDRYRSHSPARRSRT